MTLAHDTYSETNPAFCAIVLAAFTKAFISINNDGPEVPSVYLALPIALSSDFAMCFEGTNKNTGLLEWMSRRPSVQVGFVQLANLSMNIVTDSIRFGCFSRLLVLKPTAKLTLGDREIKKRVVAALSDNPAQTIKHAERLGYWFASAGSTRAIFDIMGLTV
jgi:hypothetical protein